MNTDSPWMFILAVVSLVTALAGWLSIRWVLKVPALRQNMWPVWALQVLSLLIALVALALTRDSKITPGLLCAVAAFLSFCLFVLVYLVALLIPSREGRPAAGSRFPEIKVTTEDGQRVSPRELVGKGPAMIIFFRGFWCLSCTDELMHLGKVREALQQMGGDILAISADKLQVLLAGKKRLRGLPCQIACDPDGEAITTLHLLQDNMARIGKKVAIPSTILIDRDGVVRWTHYAHIVMDRPDPRLVLAQVNALQ